MSDDPIGKKLSEHLKDVHGEEHVIVKDGGVVVSQDCNCPRCST